MSGAARPRRRVIIYASELAAFVGRNRYENPAVAAAKIWRRACPETYLAAEARTGVQLRTHEQVVQDMHVNLDAAVAETNERAADVQVAAALDRPLFSDAVRTAVARDICTAVAARTEKGAQDPATASAVASTVAAAAQGPLTSAASTAVQRAAAQLLGSSVRVAAEARASAQVQLQVPFGAPAADVAREQARIETQVQAHVEAQVQAHVRAEAEELARTIRVRDRVDAEANVHASVNKARGKARESEALQLHEQQAGACVNHRNERFYMSNIASAAHPCWIGGRVDGLQGDRVVEVKCRRNRFFSFLPDYEKVQIHAYMHLTGKSECEVVQKFNGQVRSAVHAFDAAYWGEVCTEACAHWSHLSRVLHDEDLQDALLHACTVA